MLIAVDAAYGPDLAAGAAVGFRHWSADEPAETWSIDVEGAAEYEPGLFYKRELPVLLRLLEGRQHAIEGVVVDGYVWLSPAGQPGLGGRLHAALGELVPVIGIAKSQFSDDTWSVPVMRGDSTRPLFVTAAGIDAGRAADYVADMAGPARLPRMVQIADRLARNRLEAR